MIKFIFWLVGLLCLLGFVKSEGHSIPDVVFAKKLIKCPMYSKYCFVNLLMSSAWNSSETKMETSNSRFLKYLNIGLCRENERFKCPSKQSFEERFDNQTIDESYQVYTAQLNPVLFGQANFTVSKSGDGGSYSIIIVITQPRRWIDTVFDVWVYVFQTIISMIMGILLDVNTLFKIKILYKPVLLGVCTQYLMMPLLALLSIFLFNLPPIQSLTLFIYGCSPGGAASNNWTIMLDGDLELSAIMTFVSTISSLAVMPAWLYSVGRVFMRRANLTIPYSKLAGNLFITIGPCLLGILISHCIPKSKIIFNKIAKPFTLITLLGFLTLVLITKWYVFTLFEWKYWLTGPMIPWSGFTLAFLLSMLCGFPFKQARTISVETGIQNFGVAFMIILTNFPSPEADYAILPLMAVAFMTPLPLYAVLFVLKLIKIKKNKSSGKKEDERDQTYELAPTTDQA